MSPFSRRAFIRNTSFAAGALSRWPSRALALQTSAEATPPEPMLWYRAPAQEWSQALPVGNGRLGGMIFGDMYHERILLNEESFWSGEPRSFQAPGAFEHLPEIHMLLIEEDGPPADGAVNQYLLRKINESYQPLGFLDLRHDAAQHTGAAQYRRSLHLRDGMHTVEYTGQSGVHTRESIFVSAPDQVMVVRLETTSPNGLHFTASPGSGMHGTMRRQEDTLLLEVRAPSHVIAAEVDNANGAVTWDDRPGGKGMRAAIALCVLEQQGGQRTPLEDGIRIEGAAAVTLLLAAATSYAGRGKSPSREGLDASALALHSLEKARGAGSTTVLQQRHTDDHRALFDRADLVLTGEPAAKSDAQTQDEDNLDQLPTDERLVRFTAGGADPGLAALYFQMGRYLMMASSRPGGLPATSQGIWSHRMRPPRNGAWALNSDLPISYSLAEVANLAECHQPLFRLAQRLQVDGAESAKNFYGCGGWVAHTSADLWCSTAPDAGPTSAAIWKSGGAWLCHQVWESFLFSGDVAFLRAYYPLLRGSSLFFLEHMIGDRDGWLAMYPETSLETPYRQPDGHVAYSAIGPAMSTAIVRELLQHTTDAAGILGLDAELQTRMQAAVALMRPLAVNRIGEMQEWANASWSAQVPPQAQVPQVWPLAPGAQIDRDRTPELARAIHETLLNRAPWQAQAGGWSSGWYAGALARLADEQTAYRIIRQHLATAVRPNMLSGACSPDPEFEIAGNLGVAAAIAEMLLQSHAGEVRFLPALPIAWSTGSLRGFRARGGLEVDLSWARGQATRATLRATGAQESEQVLRAPRGQRITAVQGAQGLKRLTADRVQFTTRRGRVYGVRFA